MANAKRERQRANRQLGLEQAKQTNDSNENRRKIVIVVGIIVVALLAALWYSIASKSGDDDDAQNLQTETSNPDATADSADPATSVVGSTQCPPLDGSGPSQIDFDGAPPMCLDLDKSYVAVFDTSMGEIRVDLDTDNTPNTANNFAVLAAYHYYDETEIFRTDPSIDIIQGGSPRTNDGSDPGPGYNIDDEGTGFTYEAGQLVMARSSGLNSASAQYFFVTGPNASALDSQGNYVVFGTISEGLDVAQAVIDSHVDDPASPLGGGPSETVLVNSVTIEEN